MMVIKMDDMTKELQQFIDNESTITVGQLQQGIIQGMIDHKDICDDIDCHAYTILQRAIVTAIKQGTKPIKS